MSKSQPSTSYSFLKIYQELGFIENGFDIKKIQFDRRSYETVTNTLFFNSLFIQKY